MSGELVERAAALGREHGHNAGTWFPIDSPESAQAVIDLDDGCELDYPSSPLPGEWADGLTPDLLMEQVGAPESDPEAVESWADVADQTAVQDEICSAYEDAYYQAWRDEVLRMAREQVES